MRKRTNFDSLYCFKQNNTYFGIIFCMGAHTVIKTDRLSAASLYPFNEVDTIKAQLQSHKVDATPVPYDSERPIYNRRIDALSKTHGYVRR